MKTLLVIFAFAASATNAQVLSGIDTYGYVTVDCFRKVMAEQYSFVGIRLTDGYGAISNLSVKSIYNALQGAF